MLKKEKNGITWFEFEKLSGYSHVRHAIISRSGGISQGVYQGLNLSDTVGDDALHVTHNRQKACNAIGMPCEVLHANQIHGAHVHAAYEYVDHKIVGCDALITNKKEMALGMQHADCQIAIFFDPIKNAIGCVHSGWKGNCQNIYKNTIDKMKSEYGSVPSDLIVCISPSLGPTKAEFINYKTELPESFWQFKDKDNFFNLWQVARWQLETEGVLPDNIEIAGHCTHLDALHFYSYRRDKLTGRNLTCIWLAH